MLSCLEFFGRAPFRSDIARCRDWLLGPDLQGLKPFAPLNERRDSPSSVRVKSPGLRNPTPGKNRFGKRYFSWDCRITKRSDAPIFRRYSALETVEQKN